MSTRFVGRGPHGEPPGASAWPVDRAPPPARAAERVSCTTRCATPSWMSGRGALGTPSRSKARGRVRANRGLSARLIGRGGDAGAEPAGQGAAALGVGEAVEGDRAELLEQPADGVRAQDDRQLARGDRHGLGAGHLGHGAARDVAGIDVPGGDGEPGAPARAPVRRPGDDLHPRVGHRVAQARAPAGRDRRLDVPGGPDAERLEAVLGAGGEGRAQGAPGRRRVERRGREVEAVVCRAGPAGRAGPGGRRRPPAAAAAARAAAPARRATARSASSLRSFVSAAPG